MTSLRGNAPALILVLLLLLPLVPGVSPVAAQTDYEQALREAREAKATRTAAENTYVGDRDNANNLQLQLLVTLEEYRRVNVDLEIVGLELATVRGEMDTTRAEIIALDNAAQERAVEAYMRGVATPANSILFTGSFESMSLAKQTIKRAADQDAELFQDLDDQRADLAELGKDLAVVMARMALLNDDLAEKNVELAELFALADQRVVEAFRNLGDADDAYLAAQDRLEEEERKLRWSGGVEQWRPLVVKYFPPDRVHEAMRVLACESGGNPRAKNPASTATGLFQFLDGTWAWMSVLSGWNGYSRYDPEANIAVAAFLLEYSIRTGHPAGAWGHWECKP